MAGVRTWIVICDGGRARVLARSADGSLRPVPGLAFEADLPRSKDLASERPGRSHESHGTARHAYEPRVDPHDQLETAFLAGIVATVAKRLEAKEFDRLVLVAPPKALGVVRAKMPDALGKAVVAEIAKDLTKTPDADIAAHLADTVVV